MFYVFIFRSETPVLYHIIPEKRNERIGNSMMGSSHVYDMSNIGVVPPPPQISRRAADREGMVELALDPSELDMDSDAMAVRYEQQMRENQSQLQKEDLSDMLAEHVAKQKVAIVNTIFFSKFNFYCIEFRFRIKIIKGKRRGFANFIENVIF